MRVFPLLLWGCSLLSQASDTQGINILASRILGTDNLHIEQNLGSVSIAVSDCGKGFVIFSKGSHPHVIGFSKESEWKEEEMPPVLMKWLQNYKVDKEDNVASPPTPMEGEDITVERASVEPLISTHWHQSSPYNDYAPMIADGNVKTAAGCVAIAGAQIIYYWWRDNPLSTLRNTPVYPYGGAPVTYSIPKGTPNDWELIQPEYNDSDSCESRDAVARLCYVIGTTSYLNYASSTGGQIDDASKAMYSQYSLLSDVLYRNKCPQGQWEAILYDEVSNGRPVMCAGQGGGGHAFVLDGYDSELNLYHFNFGWGGKGDGYYPVDSSANSMGGYKNNQSIVYNIHPKNRNIQASMSIREYSTEGVNLNINITNCSTLPATVSLYYNTYTSTNTQDETLCWRENVDNNNELTEYNVEIKEIPQDGIILKLYDENKTLLCQQEHDITDAVDDICVEDENSIFDIQGKITHGNTNHGVYIIKRKGSFIKVLK